jgi:hypothetical protein
MEVDMTKPVRFVLATVVLVALFMIAGSQVAFAGSPHFVSNTLTASRSGNTLTVSGKEAGLGDEEQITVVVSATAACINPGGHGPKAANKQTVSAGENVPVQNGKAEFSIDLTATFQPECSPPMTVVFSKVTVTDQTNGISKTFPGTF